MHQFGNLLKGECDMQLVGLKDTFFPVKYKFVLSQDSAASRSISVSAVQSIECVDVGGLPAGTYILTDLPNLVLSNFKGEWTFTTTA